MIISDQKGHPKTVLDNNKKRKMHYITLEAISAGNIVDKGHISGPRHHKFTDIC